MEEQNHEIHFSHSEQMDKLFEALAKAQCSFGAVKKERTNPFFKSKYADLQAVIDAIKKPLSENGLSIVQLPGINGSVVVTTILGHSSGQWMQSTLRMPTAKGDAQGIGSAITYARRYSLQAIVGVSAEEDDDGNAAVSAPSKGKKVPTKEEMQAGVEEYEAEHADRLAQFEDKQRHYEPLPGERTVTSGISLAQRQRMFTIGKTNGWTDQEIRNLLGTYGFEHSSEVTKQVYEKICKDLETKKGGVA